MGDRVLERYCNGLIVGLLTVAGFAVPTVLYLWFVGHYGLNLIQGDLWHQVVLFDAERTGHLTLGMVWAEQALQRVFFPNLVFLLLDETVHFNVVFVLYTGAAMLIVGVAILIVSHQRRSGLRWLWYCPLAILMLSIVQYEATLDGFALSWYMVLLALALSLFLLDKRAFGWPWFVAAMVVATVGSFSSFQGLLIWPAGLVLLYYRRRPWPMLLSWCAVGVAEAVVYFHGWTGPSGDRPSHFLSYFFHHPAGVIDFFLYAVGDILGVQGATRGPVYLFGVVILSCAVWALVRVGRRREDVGASALGSALIVFGLLWAASLTASQVSTGIYVSTGSRYTMYDMLILGGAYLVVLDPPAPRTNAARRSRILLGATAAVIVGAMGAQWVVGTGNGIAGGHAFNRKSKNLADITVNFSETTNAQLFGAAWLYAPRIPFEDPLAQQLHLGQFSTDLAALYARAGIEGGKWAGSTRPHVLPWRGVGQGQVVTVTGGGFSSGGPTLAVVECSQNLVNDVPVAGACDPQGAVQAPVSALGTIRVQFPVATGPVGNGSCDAGQVCYLSVVHAKSHKLVAYAEVLVGRP